MAEIVNILNGNPSTIQESKLKYLHQYKLDAQTKLLLWKKDNCIVVPKSCQVRIIQELHDTLMAGHSGIKKTFTTVARKFYWPRMRQLVEKYVITCETYSHVKAGLLQPLPISEECWTDISMDFITGLPPSGLAKNDAVLTIVDQLTCQAHFWATHTTASAEDIAKLLIGRYLPLHGIPQSIISDCDLKFTSQFWQSFFGTLGTKL